MNEALQAAREGDVRLLLDEVREELVNASSRQGPTVSLEAFELHDGRLRQVRTRNKADPASTVTYDAAAPILSKTPRSEA